ncbi:MAG: DUF5615 family PIN-like protein [Treponema sp.]|nr:DUF5615 family PIN-like protein [Treponema sp.]
MKILVDMNLSPKWIGYLNENGINAIHWSSISYPDFSDEEIILYAKEHGFAILTNDLDFGFFLAITKGKKPSVIQVRSEVLSPDLIGKMVVCSIKQLTTDIENGALVTIDPRKTRITLLPLQ